jgi:hypothetical protein
MLLVTPSCKKDISSIGLNLNEDLLNATYTDTITLTAYSVREDSLKTANLVYNFLGFMKDEMFGATTASFCTQFIPSGNNINFGESPELDSIVLILRYTGGFYGDTLNPFAIKVYELTEEISPTDTFYHFSSIANTGINITYDPYFLLYPTPNTKVRLDTVYEPHARIRLSDELGNSFLQNASQLANSTSFKAFFKGLYICAEQLRNDGSLVNFTIHNSGLSGIQLYYKNNDEAKKFSFIIKDKEVRFSIYDHDYEIGNPDFQNQVIENNTFLGKEKLYVQSMGGVKTKITFPYLKSLKDKKIVINKAELVITNIGEDENKYPPPIGLSLQAINLKGDVVFFPDLDYGPVYFGGSYVSKDKEYRFRVTRYVQDMILRDNYEPYFYLVTAGAAANASRLILCGYDPTNLTDKSSRLRLEVYYTEY